MDYIGHNCPTNHVIYLPRMLSLEEEEGKQTIE